MRSTSQGKSDKSSIFKSRPGHFALRLGQHDALQEADGFFEAFARGHEAVFVLNGKRTVISSHAQRGNEVAPEMPRISVADGAKNPGAIRFVAVMLGVEHAVALRVPFV